MRGMEAALQDRTVASLDIRRAGLRVPFPPDLADTLTGRMITNFSRRAKYILIRFDAGQTLVLHLGMSGRVTLVPPGDAYVMQKHDHLIFHFDDGTVLAFNDPRRFGMVLLAGNDNELASLKAFAGLGPEPLGNDFSGAVLYQTLKGRKTLIKAALLDQRLVAGLGNIYVSEALYGAGIDPRRQAGSLSAAEAELLVQQIRDVLNRAIAAGGSTLKDYRHADGELGYFQHDFAVYDRAGAACPACDCDVSKTGGIKKIMQAGRSTYFCPQKQV